MFFNMIQFFSNLREFVENSRHPKTPACGLGVSDLWLLTLFLLNPGNPRNPGMNSKNAKTI